MIPTRKKSPLTDEQFVSKQLAEIDKNLSVTTPQEDTEALQVMALSPMPKAEVVMPSSRDNSTSALLAKAYGMASQLKLTKEEQSALRADFPDSDFQRGAGGDTNLIYLEHCALRNRLSDVIGLGEWSFVIIRSWNENYMAGNPPKEATRIYIEGALIIRGIKVGEAIGDGSYFKSNPKTNYGDAYESAKTASFRRCCKDWGIGMQPYSKDFCEKWKQKYPGFNRPE